MSEVGTEDGESSVTDATKSMEAIISALKAENIRLRRELDRVTHRQSGMYNFRHEELRDMSWAAKAIEQGDVKYGMTVLDGVLRSIHPGYRDFG